MTIDKARLKALAEAATPGRNFDRLPEAGGGLKYECTGDEGSLVLKVDHKNDEWGFVGDNGEADEAFFLACTPATVLELLSEIERLDLDNRSLRGSLKAYAENMKKQVRAAGKVSRERDQLKAENEALRKEREGKALVPAQPSPGLLMSMAIRNDHALGCPGYYDQTILGRKRGYEGVSHARMLECALSEMRKLHEEVVGSGFYSPEKEDGYAAMSKESGHD